MIGLYADKVIKTDLPLLVPFCEAPRPNVVPYVDEDLGCLMRALRTAYMAVAVRTQNKVLVKIAEEMRPDLLILVDGLRIYTRRIRPLLRPGQHSRGYFVVADRSELSELDKDQAEGVFLNYEAFPQEWVQAAVSGSLKCSRCNRCGPLDLLLCDSYRELEVI
ncbi:hypothetical protein [Thermoproteus tenax]|uniref:Uncharacterized protein n=1 Tax=Thermoproteus tenax (strain ATCC 35583 / DSM 2078 / JCM 9277 / NBRC 100435 / Kra 1) TaxID=768679 RepID=G4RMR2_THETK|nr:hypothetical protein [Thermoproteus tenax]CCC80856.1 hypothetical protein TTX_0179 [Thermoproteus tenax Kra 1]